MVTALYKDNSSELVSPQALYSRGQYIISAKITVNNASNAGLQTGHGKGERLNGHPDSKRTNQRERKLGQSLQLSAVEDLSPFKISDKKSYGNS